MVNFLSVKLKHANSPLQWLYEYIMTIQIHCSDTLSDIILKIRH